MKTSSESVFAACETCAVFLKNSVLQANTSEIQSLNPIERKNVTIFVSRKRFRNNLGGHQFFLKWEILGVKKLRDRIKFFVFYQSFTQKLMENSIFCIPWADDLREVDLTVTTEKSTNDSREELTVDRISSENSFFDSEKVKIRRPINTNKILLVLDT